MADKKAEEYIKIYDIEHTKTSSFRSLWQDTADLQFPRESNIADISEKGSDQTSHLSDYTAIEDSKTMSDGLTSAIIPAGQYFFKLNVSKYNIGGQSEEFDNYLHRATDRLHVAMFASNFLLQLSETLRSLVVFGTGNLFSEWSKKAGGLNYKDYDIALYQILENSKGRIDTIYIKFPYTARQAFQEWGKSIGQKVGEALNDPNKENNTFPFIHVVRPRENRNPRYEDYFSMPFESVYIDVDDKIIVDEGGYEEFPYHIPRWMKTTGEVFGRGVGTQVLPQVRVLQHMMSDFIEYGNKIVNPARDILSSFDGEYRVFPGAHNEVSELPVAKIVEMGSQNFPYVEKEILMQRDVVHTAYKRDVFVQLADLKGDRRTTVEIDQRIIEGLRRIGQPAHRIYSELLEDLIKRSLSLMIRNGELEEPPLGLEEYDIEYLGLMANALSSGQARGFQQWVAVGTSLVEAIPSIMDNVNIDEGFVDLGRAYGVKAEHINTPEERDAIRESRAEQLKQKQLLELGQAAAQGYSQTTGAPEEGSPAGDLMEAASA